MSYKNLYSNIKLCKENRCDQYCEIDKCFPNKIVCLDPNKSMSKICPPMFCNFEKQCGINSRIYERNLAFQKMDIIPDYRGQYKVCDKYIDMNMTPKVDLENKINRFNNVQNRIEQGEGYKLQYLKNIDIDSEIKRVPYNYSLCDQPKYHKPTCPDGCFICDDMCRSNAKDYIKNVSLINNSGSYNVTTIKKIDAPNSCMYKPLNMTSVNIDRDYPVVDPCVSNPIRITDENSDKNKKYNLIVPGSYTVDMNLAPVLKLGPERCDNNITNLWNNNTKRRYNSDTLEHFM
jgi:hypothetical protein